MKDGSHSSQSAKTTPSGRRKRRKRSKISRKKRYGANKQISAVKGLDVVRDVRSTSVSSEISEGAMKDSEGEEEEVVVDVPPAHRLRSASNPGSGSEGKELINIPRKRRKLVDSLQNTSSSSQEKKIITPTPAIKKRKLNSLSVTLPVDLFKCEEPSTTPSIIPITPSHYSTPLSNDPLKKKKKKRIPYTLVEASKGNRCPTEGCDGYGHITGIYAMHFAVSGCPKAHGKTGEECRARREELNRLRNKNMPPQEEDPGGGLVMERSLRRTQRSSVGGVVGGGGNVTSLAMSKKIHSQVRLTFVTSHTLTYITLSTSHSPVTLFLPLTYITLSTSHPHL